MAKKMKIAAFAKYMGFNVGGAERSTVRLLLHEFEKGSEITLISLDQPEFLKKDLVQLNVPNDWQWIRLKNFRCYNRFPYWEYILNRKRIRRFFSTFMADELWVYSFYAPAALSSFNGKVKYFIRSESDLGVTKNYKRGFLRWIKYLQMIIECPAAKLYRRELLNNIQSADVVANSNYMAMRAFEVFGVHADVVYPNVSIDLLRTQLSSVITKQKWVVFVGDSSNKGLDIVCAVAKKLQNIEFRIFSRLIDNPIQIDNILWSPWVTEPYMVYQGAKLVLVPSQWEEAYGRVAREAYLLNIPVLVSKLGGLPEAVEQDQKCLVQDYKNPKVWCNKIKSILDESQV